MLFLISGGELCNNYRKIAQVLGLLHEQLQFIFFQEWQLLFIVHLFWIKWMDMLTNLQGQELLS